MRHVERAKVVALAASALLAVTLVASPDGAAAADRARTHEVRIQGLLYVPQTLTVRPGDVVVWTNNDPFPHTVTAAGVFDSGPIAAGKSWRYTVKNAGTHPYLCTLHTTMKGTLRIEWRRRARIGEGRRRGDVAAARSKPWHPRARRSS